MSSSITTITLFSIFFSIFPSPSSTTPLNFLPPFLSPLTGDVCKEVECGMGKCKMSGQNDLAYECECDAGWKQSLFSNASALKFLPCVIPNCTLNSSCSEVSAPDAAQENTSIFEPCNWANCGGGVCEKMSDILFTCKCKDRFTNLLNNPAFPCITQCTLNRSCSEAEAEAPAPNLFPANVSILEPCEWMNCGGGECKKKSGLSYTCECRQGYANLLNSTAYPCFKQCTFGGDCSVPGFNVQSQTAAASTQNAMTSPSLGNTLQPEPVLNAAIILAMSVAVIAL